MRTTLSSFRRLPMLALASVLLLVGLASLQAQTTVTSTTLSAAVTATADTLSVTSATGFDAGDIVVIDREAMTVRAVSGTLVTVTRGTQGTAARAHASNAIVYVGAPNNFYADHVVPGSTCTASAERYLPRIVLPAGYLYQCTGGVWQELGSQIGTVPAMFMQGPAPADALDTIFFVADRPYMVTAVRAVWGTAESTGDMDIMVEKLTGTTACASGTDVLSAVIDASSNGGGGTANTVNSGSLSATASALALAAGDRLCVDLTATPNEVANMVVTVTLAPR